MTRLINRQRVRLQPIEVLCDERGIVIGSRAVGTGDEDDERFKDCHEGIIPKQDKTCNLMQFRAIRPTLYAIVVCAHQSSQTTHPRCPAADRASDRKRPEPATLALGGHHPARFERACSGRSLAAGPWRSASRVTGGR